MKTLYSLVYGFMIVPILGCELGSFITQAVSRQDRSSGYLGKLTLVILA
jgi:hypothetical protein